jgi:hypothetical protein
LADLPYQGKRFIDDLGIAFNPTRQPAARPHKINMATCAAASKTKICIKYASFSFAHAAPIRLKNG